MKNIEERLGDVVKSLRLAAGMTQENLAQALTDAGWSVRQNTIAKLEGALRPTTVYELAVLARVFQMDFSDLVGLFDAPDGDDEETAIRQRLAENRAALRAARAELAQLDLEAEQLRERIQDLEADVAAFDGDEGGDHVVDQEAR